MRSELAKKLVADAQKRLGLSPSSRRTAQRFRHRQVDIWSRAFNQADRNGRIAVALGVLLALSLALNIVQQGRPANVIFVDQLGNAKYFPELASPEPPRDLEAENFSRRWVEDFLSRDATMAKKLVARALSVTEPTLREKLKQQIVDSGEIDRARDANLHTAIDVKSAVTKHVADDRLEVTVGGQRIFSAVGAERKTLTEPFTITLLLSVTDRTEVTENGLLVRYVGGSFGDNHALGAGTGGSK